MRERKKREGESSFLYLNSTYILFSNVSQLIDIIYTSQKGCLYIPC